MKCWSPTALRTGKKMLRSSNPEYSLQRGWDQVAKPSLSTQISCLQCSFTYTVTLHKYNSIFTSLAISASFSMIIIQPLINSTNICLPCSFWMTNCKCGKFLFGFCSEINFILRGWSCFSSMLGRGKLVCPLVRLHQSFIGNRLLNFAF